MGLLHGGAQFSSETVLGGALEDVVTFTLISGGDSIPEMELGCHPQQLRVACG